MTTLIFTPDRNSRNKKDFTGAFRPEAQAFARIKKSEGAVRIVEINTSKPLKHRRDQVLEALKSTPEDTHLATVAFFCHGYADGIQFGFKNEHIPELVAAMKDVVTNDVCLPFYACSSANTKVRHAPGGDGGFCDELRDELCRQGMVDCSVIGHTTVGHTTRNPYVRVFNGNGSSIGGTGGHWAIRPRSTYWKKWIKWLRADDNRFLLDQVLSPRYSLTMEEILSDS